MKGSASVDQRLEKLKGKMTEQQRRDMAELLSNEMKRREGGAAPTAAKSVKSSRLSSPLNNDQIGELYSDVNDAVKQLRLRKLEEKLATARGQKPKRERQSFSLSLPKVSLPRFERGESAPVSGNSALLYSIVSVGALKILFTGSSVLSGVTPQIPVGSPAVQRIEVSAAASPAISSASVAAIPADKSQGSWSPAEAKLLAQLDSRRVELEHRSADLDKKEADMKGQATAFNERIAELKTLTDKLSHYRQEKDQQRESRLEQLASVYGSMEPAEAAGLMAKLDEEIALSLLQRMPGKRMGQILGLMDKERAVALTRILSDSKSGN